MDRKRYLKSIQNGFRINPVVALLGMRQVGKSTLAREWATLERKAGRAVTFFDLEKESDLAALQEPYSTLKPLAGSVVIDEIQLVPELFKTLRVLADESQRKTRYLILGSASRDLIHQSSETLAGRIHYVELSPFDLAEVPADAQQSLWLRGGLPLSFLANNDHDSDAWRQDYIRTFLERDIPKLGIRIPAPALRRFWMMLTHVHGQLFNASEIGRSLGVSDHTVRHYLDILEGTFMIRRVAPWFENLAKRQIKSPKIFFRDSGLFHSLQGIGTYDALVHHPKLGASWEGFAVEEVIRHVGALPENVYSWGIHSQVELDLFILQDGKRMGFEVKYTDSPVATPSMRQAIKDLKLDSLTIIYPGEKSWPVDSTLRVASLQDFVRDK